MNCMAICLPQNETTKMFAKCHCGPPSIPQNVASLSRCPVNENIPFKTDDMPAFVFIVTDMMKQMRTPGMLATLLLNYSYSMTSITLNDGHPGCVDLPARPANLLNVSFQINLYFYSSFIRMKKEKLIRQHFIIPSE